MKKGLVALALIIVIIIVGFALSRSSDKAEPAEEEKTEQAQEAIEKTVEGEGEQAITKASASYVASKGWFNKPTQEVLGTTASVTGSLNYNSETSTLEDVDIEIDDQSFSTGTAGRDSDVRKMFANAGNITVSLVNPIEIPTRTFSTTIPLKIEINGVSQTVNFTVQGDVSAEASSANGRADITFEQFGLTPPSVAKVYNVANELSVEFTIQTSS